MNIFFSNAGPAAIGSRLRLLTDRISSDAEEIYKLYQVPIQPKWYPVFFILASEGSKSVTALAKDIGHSHPSVSKIVREMSKAGLVKETKDKNDGRRNMIKLTEKGRKIIEPMQSQYLDVGQAVNELLSQSTCDLWKAIEECEYLLDQKSLFDRVKEVQKKRESAKVKIVDYKPEYASVFRSLNEEWITKYFKMEASDHKALDNPDESIIQKGGYILVALYDDLPMGVCALLKMQEGDCDFELAKMAVSPEAQGKNIGWLLGQAALHKARELGARKIYLESNTILKPAISLYQKLGFKKVTGAPSPYERCNIQMEVEL
ncbi:bifunctional helix-turn-helix transcriptional regulator/GNAT family N-acetyltransferase [Desertivirga brevis]|uniref:bifunctional helix-turn-helix transcriptional regulator/GNAT family N-acetyltransferase n=1 Tax=Desertivirga brevis TaxID=2810310 RepID=UPI001A97C4CC|nr:helix-turn-helix domain-containing GNAT family N-acetyltransferase [Pedobacter sp. SYSU D00873]